jgi:undecaprenyl-diphosphatase
MGRVRARAGRTLPPPLAAAGIAAAALAVLLLGGLVVDHWPFAWDRTITLWMAAHRTPARTAALIDLTALGGATLLTLIVVLVTGFLLVQRLWLTALLTMAASVSGGLVVSVAKHWVGRARPDIVERLVVVANASFPSGHATNSAVCYLTMAALASQVVRDRASQRYLIGAAVLLVGAIGISRVYLGVHWASDVMTGWSFGTLWALAWWWLGAKARASIGGKR